MSASCLTVTVYVCPLTYVLSDNPEVWKLTNGTDLHVYMDMFVHKVVGVTNNKKKSLSHAQIKKKNRKAETYFGHTVADISYHLLCAAMPI